MWNLPTALMQRRQMCRRSLVVLTLIGLAASSAAAGDIVITNGYLDRTPYAGPLVIRGDRGFIFVGHPGNGLFQILNDCNAGDAPCGPGDRVSLAAAWSGQDLPGSATLDGVSYPKVGDIASLNVEFSATVTLPRSTPRLPSQHRLSSAGGSSTRTAVSPSTAAALSPSRWNLIRCRDAGE